PAIRSTLCILVSPPKGSVSRRNPPPYNGNSTSSSRPVDEYPVRRMPQKKRSKRSTPGSSTRGRMAALVAAVVVLALAGGLIGWKLADKPEGHTTLALAFAPGTVERYALQLNFDGTVTADNFQQVVSTGVTGMVVLRVLSVSGDGIATIQMHIEQLVGTMGGTPVTQSKLPPSTIRVARDGRVLSGGGLTLRMSGGV